MYNDYGDIVYTRTIHNPPKKIVEKGMAVFGDFNFPPQRLSIQRLRQPFSLMPLPNFITKLRIRANLCFSFTMENYIGTVEIIDARYFAFAEVSVLDTINNKKHSYRTIIPRRRTIPLTAQQGTCKSFKKNRFILIKWDYAKNTFSINCRLKHDKTRPDLHFAFSANLSEETSGTPVSVIPCPTTRRCAAIHHMALPLEGTISEESSVLTASPFVSEGLGFFTIRRSFYNLRTKCHSITAQGIVDGKHIQFNLYTSNQDPFDPDKYNENVLFVDGVPTPLPPVTITHPRGVSKQWYIQDTESMIDISFFPSAGTVRKNSILILRTQYHTLFGSLEGNISDKDGKLYPLKDCLAVAKKQYLRL